MKSILKDRHVWIIVALLIIWAIYTYFQDYGNVSWLPSDETEPLTETVIDLIFFINIVNLGAFWFHRRGGLIVGIPAFSILVWCHIATITELDSLVFLLFTLLLGFAIADIVSRYVKTSRGYAKALKEVKTLSGLIPICAWCKKIRNDKGYWSEVEHYIGEHSKAEFTHGMCPECYEKYFLKEEGLS